MSVLTRNPVFEHEFLRFCRTKRWYLVRTGLVGALTLVLWLFFLQGRGDILAGNLDAVGRSLFSAACFVLVLFVVLATPGLTADLIASERRTGNLEVLLSTPLPRAGIVFGKVLSRISLLLVMVASSFPAISITLLFGGVRIEQVAALFLTATGLVLGLAGPSLLFSSVAERSGLPAVLAYLFALFPAGILFMSAPAPESVFGFVRTLALPPARADAPLPFLRNAAIVLGAGTVVFALGTWLALLQLRISRRGAARGAVRAVRRRGPRSRTAWDRGNPISTWEARRVRGRAGIGSFSIILGLLLVTEVVVLLVPAVRSSIDAAGAHAAVATAEAFVILLFAALAGSTTVIADREQGKIELLRLTRLSPREVVHGKALGTTRAVVPLALIPTLHLLVVGGIGAASLGFALAFAVVLAVAAGVSASDGVMNSIQGSTVQSAVMRSVWHFCWLTLFLPLVQVLLPLVFTGEVLMPEGPQFSLLYPIHYAAARALGHPGTPLDLFGFLFWIALLAIMAVGIWMLLAQGGTFRRTAATTTRRDAKPEVPWTDWRESWQRLAAEWHEED